MFKLGQNLDGMWREHSHAPVFSIEETASGQKKVLATAPGSDPLVFKTIFDRLTPPFLLLYVLHTPRGEAEPGRYQSDEMSGSEIREFLERFRSLLSLDSRFDLWGHSAADGATVIWDRHNLIHAYGPLDLVVETLRGLGFQPGEPTIPAPHEHHYHSGLDEEAEALLGSRTWHYSPLQSEDEQ
jgi:hypothetical protein